MKQKSILNEFYDPEEDVRNLARAQSLRRPRLTLRHLNMLRKVQELRQMEMTAHRDFVKDMYGSASDDDSPEF